VKIHQDPKFETMMIAIGIENDQIAQHFGKAEKLRLMDVSKGKIIQVRDVMDIHHLKHDRAAFLKSLGVNHILVQHMGKSMYNHFLSYGIQAVQAQSTSIEEALRLFLEDPAVKRELNPCQICQ
jgi:predicted Fe-Mo cluster-binding NifX family protein